MQVFFLISIKIVPMGGKKVFQTLILKQQSENNQDLLIVNHPTTVQNTLENSSYKITYNHLLFCFYKFQSFTTNFLFISVVCLIFFDCVCTYWGYEWSAAKQKSQEMCVCTDHIFFRLFLFVGVRLSPFFNPKENNIYLISLCKWTSGKNLLQILTDTTSYWEIYNYCTYPITLE